MARAPKKPQKRPIIMMSSTVYGYEDLLERVYTVLTNYGYEVWCSHMGTVPTNSNLSAFENCIKAVVDCDLFLGLITPYYGSGIAKGDISITHQELHKAIELNKPRWLLAHDHVVFARKLLNQLGVDTHERREALTLQPQDEDQAKVEGMIFTPGRAFDDLRLIDMYEAAIQNQVRFRERKGNWVQTFVSNGDALRYATAQFYRLQEIESFLAENLSDPAAVMRRVEEDIGKTPDKEGDDK